jgi:hypothetical protein
VQVAGNATGNTVAAWRNHAPGQIRDIVLGDPTGDVTPAHEDGWRFSGCPHSGPSVVLDSDGTRQIVWYTGASGRSGVYHARQPAGGTLSAPVALVRGENLPTAHVALAASARLGPVAAWDVTATKRRRIAIARIEGIELAAGRAIEIPGSEDAVYPQIVALPDAPTAIVAWTEPTRPRVSLAAIDWGRRSSP